MASNHEPTGRPASLGLADVLLNYLNDQSEAQAHGVGYPEVDEGAVPHDAVPVQPVDPELAWADAVAVLDHLTDGGPKLQAVPDWPVLVSNQEPALALAFCLGNFPQLVRNLQSLLSGTALAVRLVPASPVTADGLLAWAEQTRETSDVFLAAGALRLAGQYDTAAALLARKPAAGWEAVHANEVAALAWHQGEHQKALSLWEAQPNSVPVLFNRGMAALFLGQSDRARESLDAAIAALPETSAWHHLACLYRALASN